MDDPFDPWGDAAKKATPRIERKDWVLWCLAGAVAMILWFSERTKIGTVIGLAVLAVFLILPVLHIPLLRGASKIKRSLAILAMGALVAGFGFLVWPLQKPLHVLNNDERERFVRTLVENSPMIRWRVRLGCPPGKEYECLMVGQFIDLLIASHWEVEGSAVQRVTVPRPKSGLILYLHVDDKTPKGGEWRTVPPSGSAIIAAFGSIGMKASIFSDRSLPKDMLALYFGPDMN